MTKIKQVAVSYNGMLVALTEKGEIYIRERDQKHTGPGEAGHVWRKIESIPR
jgi:hypothetical protein